MSPKSPHQLHIQIPKIGFKLLKRLTLPALKHEIHPLYLHCQEFSQLTGHEQPIFEYY